MKRLAYALILVFFPSLLFADSSSLSFAPPMTDYSVLFLGNIFGVVDGVLSGTGSQIMGEMFKVFNSAVLGLGGLIIMYTLLVSTINTAHKGQMLGEKWNSVWVPVRATLGLALLVPKASGYCLIQIIVMWVVVQGVGAADKVWNAALNYLNRGGLIVQTQINPLSILNNDNKPIAQGAAAMLSGQVCMYSVQKALERAREQYLHPDSDDAGLGGDSGGLCGKNGIKSLEKFCKTAVPNFIQSVDVVSVQSAGLLNLQPSNQMRNVRPAGPSAAAQEFSVDMPNFPSNSPYYDLNGICGTLKWKAIKPQDLKAMSAIVPQNQMSVISQSRAIAIQQMYSNLSSIAELMVNNNPALMKSPPPAKDLYSPYAKNQFGIPFNAAGTPCASSSTNCTGWGSDAGSSSPLLTGDEFQNAIKAYMGIMMPTNRLVKESLNKDVALAKRKFIERAESSGWIMAGSYFIDLARINSTTPDDSNATDKDTGLDQSLADISKIKSITNKNCTGITDAKAATLCNWLQGDLTAVQAIVGLMDGSPNFTVENPQNTLNTQNFVSGKGSSTAFGYINNASNVTLPGQPGQTAPDFAMKTNFNLKAQTFEAPEIPYSCQMWYAFCIDSIVVNVGYNLVIRSIFNIALKTLLNVARLVIMAFLTVPLQGMAQIFIHGVSFIQRPAVNPIIALANMGTNYINYAMDLWMTLTQMSAVLFFLLPLLAMIMPLLIVWLGTMTTIGFLTAYYIPFLPYMIFTFGSIAWLMAVIEAMVAAPIVALGITHPEGEGAFGKGEQAIMLLMNVFLRPAMMIIGYISGIALSYVSVWIINAGFSNVVSFIQGDLSRSAFNVVGDWNDFWGKGGVTKTGWNQVTDDYQKAYDDYGGLKRDIQEHGLDRKKVPGWENKDYKVSEEEAGRIDTNIGYVGWAGIYGFFYAILIYTTMYITVVQKSFGLITALPDKVLRWIAGGQQESLGADTSQWAEEGKRELTTSAEKTAKAGGEISSTMRDTAQLKPKKTGDEDIKTN